MNPYLVGYLGMVSFFLAHAIARASYETGKHSGEALVTPMPRYNPSVMVYPSDVMVDIVEVEQTMEKYVAEQSIPMDLLMGSGSQESQHHMVAELKRDLEYRVFEGIKKFVKIGEVTDERGLAAFPCKTFRASILVGKERKDGLGKW